MTTSTARHGKHVPAIIATLALAVAAHPLTAQRNAPDERAFSAPVCADSTAFTGDTTGIGYRGPAPRQMNMSTVSPPSRMKGATIEVWFLVNTVGVPDSIYTVGVTDAGFDKKLLKTLSQYRFNPAYLDGCRRQGWWNLEMTLGPTPSGPPAAMPSRPPSRD